MSNANPQQRRTRHERVAALRLPPRGIGRTLTRLREPDVMFRVGLCIAAIVVIWVISPSVRPPFAYRIGYAPQRDIVASVPFQVHDNRGTELARIRAHRQTRTVYEQDPEPIVQLRSAVANDVAKLMTEDDLDQDLELWTDFFSAEDMPASREELEASMVQFRQSMAAMGAMDRLQQALKTAFDPLEQNGFLKVLQHGEDEGNQKELYVYQKHELPSQRHLVQVNDILINNAEASLFERLRKHLDQPQVAERIVAWLKPRMDRANGTLSLKQQETERDREKNVAAVPPVMRPYLAGAVLARAGSPMGPQQIQLLQQEYDQRLAQLSTSQKVARSLSTLTLILGLFVCCGYYVVWREHSFASNTAQLAAILGLVVVTMSLTRVLSTYPGSSVNMPQWRAEMLPLLLFGMTLAISFSQQLALLISGAVAMLLVLTFGHTLGYFIVSIGALSTAVLMLSRIRSRSKMIVVGAAAGAVASLLTICVGILDEQPLESALFIEAARNFMWPLAAGFLISGMLPFIERMFGVVTDLSLLELGDVAHPLLQELIRRAPGTYNHSINVASIAEAAADNIGASGLLVRVGAYFHDIGKMLKPKYFVENRGNDEDRHESLVPAMSTLIIIAHVKDGADLGRQHRLPQPLIDFIEQHHGTTLVEFFYARANQQSGEEQVDENRYRYPGPKPQTKEAGVLMLADAVEGACRTLVEPTPARIENLVHELSLKRLMDGQFDESGLSLSELKTIESSLIKSLTAIHHGRIKYPSQQTA